MMGHVALLLFVHLLLHLVLVVGWLVAAWHLPLARRAALHWSTAALLLALCLGLCLARGAAPAWLTVGVADGLGLATLILLIRGQHVFARLPLPDALHAAVASICLCLAWWWQEPDAASQSPPMVMLASLALAFLLAHSVVRLYPVLKREHGVGMACALLAPQGAIGGLFAIRLAGGLLQPQVAAQPIQHDNPFNLALLLLLLLLGLLWQGALMLTLMLRLVGRLVSVSQRDGLTGLLNRAEWARQLEVQHRWLGRFGDAYGLLVIDVDHFKRINDSLGHAAGDAALVSLAQMLTATARQVDIVARLGGEEFGVLLPRSDPVAALRAAERIRQSLADTEFSWHGQVLKLTVSVGVAIGSNADEPPATLVERADQALYQAKREGRNRCVVAPLRPVDETQPGDAGPDTAPLAAPVSPS